MRGSFLHSVSKMLSARTLGAINRCMAFASKSNFENLQNYFQIFPIRTGSQEKQVQIWIETTDTVGEYILALRVKEQGIPLEIFPEDIERLIYGYLRDENQIRIQMKLPDAFPIRSPSFKLLSSTKSSTEIQNIVHQMNCDLNVDYSPALAIEKTALILIVRILEAIKYNV